MSATTSSSLLDISSHMVFFLKNQQILKISSAIFENSVWIVVYLYWFEDQCLCFHLVYYYMLLISVDGKLDRPPIRSFSRTFVTVPGGSG